MASGMGFSTRWERTRDSGMENEAQATTIALAIGVPLMFAGFHVLERLRLTVTVRAIVGCVLLGMGIVLADQLADGSGKLFLHPVRFGISIALLGLGINQAAAPLRAVLGKPGKS